MSHRVRYVNPFPLTDVVGSVTFDGTAFELRRGLLATLDAARAVGASRLALATLQVAWYTETQGGVVPASCQRTLERAKAEAAR